VGTVVATREALEDLGVLAAFLDPMLHTRHPRGPPTNVLARTGSRIRATCPMRATDILDIRRIAVEQ
jgi:hypothetical protein